MRYLVNVLTGESVTVDDDPKFMSLLSERTPDGRQLYEQTGPQDPRVTQVTVPGESHGPTTFDRAGLDPTAGDAPAPRTALGDEPLKPSDIANTTKSSAKDK